MEPPPGLNYNSFRKWRTGQGIRGTRRDVTTAWKEYSTTLPSTSNKKTSVGRKKSTSRKTSPRRVPSPATSSVGKSPPPIRTPKRVPSPEYSTRPFPVEHIKEYRILNSDERVNVSSLILEDVHGRLVRLVPYAVGRLLGTPTVTGAGRTPYTRMWVFIRDGHLLEVSDYKQTTATLAAVRGVLPTPDDFWESSDEWTFLLSTSPDTPREYEQELRRVLVREAGRGGVFIPRKVVLE